MMTYACVEARRSFIMLGTDLCIQCQFGRIPEKRCLFASLGTECQCNVISLTNYQPMGQQATTHHCGYLAVLVSVADFRPIKQTGPMNDSE